MESTKKYFKIKEVAEMLDVAPSTLRYWEKEFPHAAPKRTRANLRLYTEDDIRELRIIRFLLKEKGLKIEAARQALRANKENVFKRVEIIDRLGSVRDELSQMLKALNLRQ